MEDSLKIEWPWEIVDLELVDDFVEFIKCNLPSDHELQGHELFPGIKWDGKPTFIVDDDTTGEFILMNFEKMDRRGKSGQRAPTMTVLRTRGEVAAVIKKDHQTEVAKVSPST